MRSSADAFRRGMRALPHGVTVIATRQGGARNGLTATSVVSLSVDPPALLFCVARTSSAWPALRVGAAVSVNVLSGSQEEIADRFAGRCGAKDEEKFSGGLWIEVEGGPPVLQDAIVSFVCEVDDTIDREAYTIVIARVRETRLRAEECALVYAQGRYDRIGWSEQEVRAAAGLGPQGGSARCKAEIAAHPSGQTGAGT
jgi:flavin reductase (DIM6/NTAB) family NADH-FMN oxidoreductase RutF